MNQNPMVNYASIIEETSSKHFNVADQFKGNSIEENIAICEGDRLSFSVGAINVTGDLNLGIMIRTASLLGADNFYTFGRKKYDKRSTVGAHNYINMVQYPYDNPLDCGEELLRDLTKLQERHMIIVCEQNGSPLHPETFSGNARTYQPWANATRERYQEAHPLFLFGSESYGIPQPAIDMVPPVQRISIPQRGVLRSFNVSTAMSIILWAYVSQVFL